MPIAQGLGQHLEGDLYTNLSMISSHFVKFPEPCTCMRTEPLKSVALVLSSKKCINAILLINKWRNYDNNIILVIRGYRSKL